MHHEFDNTFESLLQRAATRSRGDVLPENAAHLDADSISAFAENVLPDTTRARFASHLADCSDCRQILVNFASIREAEESEIIETKTASPAQPTWNERFKRWFALPNLGYAAAALTVLFIGVFAFVAVQSRQENQNPQVAQAQIENEEAQLAEKRRAARTQPPQPEPTVESTPEILADMATNFAESENANLAQNSNQNAEQSPNRGLPPSVVATRGGQQSNSADAGRREPEAVKEPARPANVSNTNTAGSIASASPAPTPSVAAKSSPDKTVTLATVPPNSSDEQKRAADQEQETAESLNLKNRTNPAVSAPAPGKSIAGRTINGKTFQHLEGVWRDAAYNGQAKTIVARGSDEYKKLDGGLRSIADKFKGETVIVVWQGKAYQIR